MLLHHHQDERRDDVERGDHDDERDGERDGLALERQGAEQRLVHVGPVLGQVIAFADAVDARGNLRRRPDVVDTQLDEVDVGLAEDAHRVVDRDEAVGRIELGQAQLERAGDAQAPRRQGDAAGHLRRRDDRDTVADRGVEFGRQLLAEQDAGLPVLAAGQLVAGRRCGSRFWMSVTCCSTCGSIPLIWIGALMPLE